jgi:hypothetical protein
LAPGIGDRGFVRDTNPSFRVLEPDGLQPKSMNDSGALLGVSRIGAFVQLPQRSIEGLEHPACPGLCTIPTGISESGDIVGQYQLGNRVYGFIATPKAKR